MVEFMQQGTTITPEVYCETLIICVGLFKTKCVECSSMTMRIHRQLLTLEHCNYPLFTYLKNWLRSQCFSNNEELMEYVKTWLSSQAAGFFGIGIQKLIPQYDSCLNSGCDYVEK
jgi:hypothetical protein